LLEIIQIVGWCGNVTCGTDDGINIVGTNTGLGGKIDVGGGTIVETTGTGGDG